MEKSAHIQAKEARSPVVGGEVIVPNHDDMAHYGPSSAAEAHEDTASDAPGETDTRKDKQFWDDRVDWIRRHTHPMIVNNSSRVTNALFLTGNVLSIVSARWMSKYNHKAGSAMGVAAWIGLTGNVVGMFWRERPQTEEDLQRYSDMSWGAYIPNKIIEGAQFWKHPTTFMGLCNLANGLYSMKGDLAASDNPINMGTAKHSLTIVGSASLAFHPNQERAWQGSGVLMGIRSFFSFGRAWQMAFKGASKNGVVIPAGNYYDLTKMVINQAANLTGILYGGIKIDDQGNIYRPGEKIDKELLKGLEATDSPGDFLLWTPQSEPRAKETSDHLAAAAKSEEPKKNVMAPAIAERAEELATRKEREAG